MTQKTSKKTDKYFLSGSLDIFPGVTLHTEIKSQFIKIGYKNPENIFMRREVSKDEALTTMKRQNRNAVLSDKGASDGKERRKRGRDKSKEKKNRHQAFLDILMELPEELSDQMPRLKALKQKKKNNKKKGGKKNG